MSGGPIQTPDVIDDSECIDRMSAVRAPPVLMMRDKPVFLASECRFAKATVSESEGGKHSTSSLMTMMSPDGNTGLYVPMDLEDLDIMLRQMQETRDEMALEQAAGAGVAH